MAHAGSKKKKARVGKKKLIDPHSNNFWAPTNTIFGPFQQKLAPKKKFTKFSKQISPNPKIKNKNIHLIQNHSNKSAQITTTAATNKYKSAQVKITINQKMY